MNIETIRANRFKFLKTLYEVTEANEHKVALMGEVGESLGFDKAETRKIAQFLKGQYLLEFRTLGGGISITHHGIIEVENALSAPEQPTQYFPPVSIIQVGTMVGSAIQQNSSESSQNVNYSYSNVSEIKSFLEELNNNIENLGLSAADRSDMAADIQTISAQIQKSSPKNSVVSECLLSIKAILEGAAGSVLGSYLSTKLLTLIGG